MANFIYDRDRDGLFVHWRICFDTDEVYTKSRPEWILAGLIVLGVFLIWYSLVYVRGWEGAALECLDSMSFAEPLPDI